MDATTVADLLVLAELAQERRRQQDPEAERLVEARYAEFLEALDWYEAAGQPDMAFRLASLLVSFWIRPNGLTRRMHGSTVLCAARKSARRR